MWQTWQMVCLHSRHIKGLALYGSLSHAYWKNRSQFQRVSDFLQNDERLGVYSRERQGSFKQGHSEKGIIFHNVILALDWVLLQLP